MLCRKGNNQKSDMMIDLAEGSCAQLAMNRRTVMDPKLIEQNRGTASLPFEAGKSVNSKC